MKGYIFKIKDDYSSIYATVEDAFLARNMICCAGSIYAVHTEKKGFNTVVIIDYRINKSDGTGAPL